MLGLILCAFSGAVLFFGVVLIVASMLDDTQPLLLAIVLAILGIAMFVTSGWMLGVIKLV